MAKIDMKRVAEAVTSALSGKFVNIKIVKVKASSDSSFEGDDILKITVVFDGRISSADADVVASAVRYVRPALSRIDADLFPLLSFVSRVDYRGRERLGAT